MKRPQDQVDYATKVLLAQTTPPHHVWMTSDEMDRWFPKRADKDFRYCKRCGRPNTTKRECQNVKVTTR